jgi:hypothetical protein
LGNKGSIDRSSHIESFKSFSSQKGETRSREVHLSNRFSKEMTLLRKINVSPKLSLFDDSRKAPFRGSRSSASILFGSPISGVKSSVIVSQSQAPSGPGVNLHVGDHVSESAQFLSAQHPLLFSKQGNKRDSDLRASFLQNFQNKLSQTLKKTTLTSDDKLSMIDSEWRSIKKAKINSFQMAGKHSISEILPLAKLDELLDFFKCNQFPLIPPR